MENPKSQFQE